MNGMPNSLKVVLLSLFAALLIAMGVLWFGPMHVLGARDEAHSNGYSNQGHYKLHLMKFLNEGSPQLFTLAPTQKPSHTQTPVPMGKPSPIVTVTATNTRKILH